MIVNNDIYFVIYFQKLFFILNIYNNGIKDFDKLVGFRVIVRELYIIKIIIVECVNIDLLLWQRIFREIFLFVNFF